MAERFLNYIPPISSELRAQYEGSMAQEKRWQNGMQFSDVEETLLDHVTDLFEIHNSVGINFPNLFGVVDKPETEHMFYIHDGGELGGLDLAHSVPNYIEVRKQVKRRERATFRYITREHIDDIELKAYVRGIYKRYDNPDPNDVIAQYVHLIDKIQAIEFGTRNVFPARKLRKKDERRQQINHDYGLVIGFAQNLMNSIDRDAGEELVELVDNTILMFRKNGYREGEVQIYRNQLRQELAFQRDTAME
jgi:hypothetical protein